MEWWDGLRLFANLLRDIAIILLAAMNIHLYQELRQIKREVEGKRR